MQATSVPKPLCPVMAMREDLVEIADVWEPFVKEAGIVGLGPRPDPRIRSLVAALDRFWQRYAGKRPTHMIEFRSGLPVSPFNKFVESVRRHFLRDQMMADDAFQKAMQGTATSLDWEDDTFLSAMLSPPK